MAERARGGRQAEAALNDERVLDAARRVLTAAPGTSMAELAAAAGVGVGSLYRRFPSKDVLVRTLCLGGMDAIAGAARDALDEVDQDPWGAFVGFLREALDRGAGSLRGLAGTFRPDAELNAAASTMNTLISELLGRAQSLGAVRDDLTTTDVGLLFEMLRAVRVGTPGRSDELRHRYLDLVAPALRATAREELSEPAPAWDEISGSWNV